MKPRIKEERFAQYKIKIEKVIQWVPIGVGQKRQDIMWIATIKYRNWSTISFNEPTKTKLWKHLKEEVYL